MVAYSITFDTVSLYDIIYTYILYIYIYNISVIYGLYVPYPARITIIL